METKGREGSQKLGVEIDFIARACAKLTGAGCWFRALSGPPRGAAVNSDGNERGELGRFPSYSKKMEGLSCFALK